MAGAGAVAAAAASRPARAFADAGSQPIYRIHPAIGVARLGNADPSTFYIGPEAPGYGPLGSAPGTVVPPYKDSGNVKPMGVRFRIFEYATVNGRLVPVGEVNLDTPGVANITWTVHLANKKASFYQFGGPAGESSAPGPLRNASVVNRSSLENDYGPRSIAGRSQAPVEFAPGDPSQVSCVVDASGNAVIPYLGQILTDSEGRLIVLGGKGTSASNLSPPPDLGASYANNDNWFDDTSDGPVTAVVTINDGGTLVDVPVDAKGGAWVLCTPPDFAPPIQGAVSAYQLLFDLAVRSIPIPPENGLYDDGQPLADIRRFKADFTAGASAELPTSVPDFATYIQPVLLAGYNYWWVDGLVTQKHNSLVDPSLADPSAASAKNRQGVLVYLRPPLGVPLNSSATTGNRTMPHLLGDDPYVGSEPDAVRRLALTHTDYALMVNWANGQFTPPAPGATPPPPTITAWGLDRAVLENCVGGAFFPGIEFGWQIRNPSLFAEPFRLNLAATSGYWGETQTIGPGHFTRQMALPWQADFNDCRDEGDYGWWPSQRPTGVLPSASAKQRVDWARPTTVFASGKNVSTHQDMLDNWWKFGFVVASGELYVETERAATIP